MSEFINIIAMLFWGVVTLAALARGVARVQDAGLAGVRALGAVALLIVVLLVANGLALLLTIGFGYCEHCADEGLSLRSVLLYLLLLLPSLVIWIALGQSENAGGKGRWD